jgi:hypothetical protein
MNNKRKMKKKKNLPFLWELNIPEWSLFGRGQALCGRLLGGS